MSNSNNKLLIGRCWKGNECDTPVIITPGKDSYTVVADAPDGGTVNSQGFVSKLHGKKDLAEFHELKGKDYLVVYCDSNHKNYIIIDNNEKNE